MLSVPKSGTGRPLSQIEANTLHAILDYPVKNGKKMLQGDPGIADKPKYAHHGEYAY